MSKAITARGGAPDPVTSGHALGKSSAQGLTIFTHGGGATARRADAEMLRSTWDIVQRELDPNGANGLNHGHLRTRFNEFCDGAAAARLRSARLALAVSTAAALVAVASTLTVAVLAFRGDRVQVLFIYVATCVALSLPLYWAARRRSRSTLVVSVLTVAATGWWATGATYPPAPRSILDVLLASGEDAAVGIALGTTLIAVLIVVAAMFAVIGALVRRDQCRLRRPDVRAFDNLLQVVVPLAEAGAECSLDLPARLAMADNIATARRAVRRIASATRKHGDRRQRRALRRGLRRWARRFRAGAVILWSTTDSRPATLRICLESMVPLLTGDYGDLGNVARPDHADTVGERRWPAKWVGRLSGAAVPPTVLVAAHAAGVPISSTVGIAVAFVAVSALVVVVAMANDSHPLALLTDLLQFVRTHGRRRTHDEQTPQQLVAATNRRDE